MASEPTNISRPEVVELRADVRRARRHLELAAEEAERQSVPALHGGGSGLAEELHRRLSRVEADLDEAEQRARAATLAMHDTHRRAAVAEADRDVLSRELEDAHSRLAALRATLDLAEERILEAELRAVDDRLRRTEV